MIDCNSSSKNPYDEEIIRDFKYEKYFNGKDKLIIFKDSICEPIAEKSFFHIFKFVIGNPK